jgi:hypothetical protein
MILTLEEASVAALRAAEADDLDALTQALTARQAALDRGEVPTPGVFSAGELATQLLRERVAGMRGEETRLRQLGKFVAAPENTFDLRG